MLTILKYFFFFAFGFFCRSQNQTNNNKQQYEKIRKYNATTTTTLEKEDKFYKKFTEEWDIKMKEYESLNTYMIPIPRKERHIFYERVLKAPTLIKGAYVLDDPKVRLLEFSIHSPTGELLYFNKSSFYGFFEFNVTMPGFYKITIFNFAGKEEIKPLLTLTTQAQKIVDKDDLKASKTKLDTLINFLQKYRAENTIMGTSKRRRARQMRENNRYFFVFSLLETVILIIVSFWQYFYLKHLFEVKGSI